MFDGARPGDTLYLNIDDPYVSIPVLKGYVITYGAHPDAEVRMVAAEVDPDTLHTLHRPWATRSRPVGAQPRCPHGPQRCGRPVSVALGLPLQGMVDRIGTYAPVASPHGARTDGYPDHQRCLQR